jgi:hypothetical protein
MKVVLAAVLAALMMAGGCVNKQKLADEVIRARNSGKEGVARVYSIPINEACAVTSAVFRWEQVDDVEDHCKEHFMIASSGMRMVACGTVMGVWMEAVDPKTTRITVLTRNRGDCWPFSQLTPDHFYSKFEQGLCVIRSGRALPVAAP